VSLNCSTSANVWKSAFDFIILYILQANDNFCRVYSNDEIYVILSMSDFHYILIFLNFFPNI